MFITHSQYKQERCRLDDFNICTWGGYGSTKELFEKILFPNKDLNSDIYIDNEYEKVFKKKEVIKKPIEEEPKKYKRIFEL